MLVRIINKDLLNVIRKSADRYNNPVVPYGYGIPHIQKAMQLAKAISGTK